MLGLRSADRQCHSTSGNERPMAVPELIEMGPRPAAVVRDTVVVSDLPAFFGRAFGAVAAAVAGQGVEFSHGRLLAKVKTSAPDAVGRSRTARIARPPGPSATTARTGT